MIKIITDSGSNIPKYLIDKYNIVVIQMPYLLNGAEQNQDTDFDGKKYYDALRTGAVAMTSMINTSSFYECFEKELGDGNDIIYVSISGGISGTFNAAYLAAEGLKEIYKNSRIEVIDSLGASLGEGLLCINAAQMVQDGKDFNEVVSYIKNAIPNMCQTFTVDDLNHLKRTGRISGVASFVGGILGIKPILIGNNEGKIIVYDKIRGSIRALDALADRYERLVLDKNETIGIAHADNENGTEYLLSALKDRGFSGECITVCYEPVTGSHVGPGTVALFFFGKGREL